MMRGGVGAGGTQSLLFAADSPANSYYSQGRGSYRTPSSAGRSGLGADRRVSGGRSGGRLGYNNARYSGGRAMVPAMSSLDGGGMGMGMSSMMGMRGGAGSGTGGDGMGGSGVGGNYATPRASNSRGGGMGGVDSARRSAPRSGRMPATWASANSNNGSMLMPTPGSGMRQRARGGATPRPEGPPTRSYDDEDDDYDDEDDMGMDATMGMTPGSSMLGGGGGYDAFGGASAASNGLALVGGAQNGGGNMGGLSFGAGVMAQNDVLGGGDDACWVTAFGFRPGMSDDVLRHFQKYGTIISQQVSNSNWLHIQYETRDQANKAIGANGRIHDGYMLGVVWRSEADVMANNSELSSGGHHRLAKRTPTSTLASTHLDSESIFKPRRRRKNICTRMCEYLFKSSW